MDTQAMPAWDVGSVADELLACERERRARTPFTDSWPGLNIDVGYAIQDRTLERRLTRGETLIGIKLGLTSKAKQARMGIDAPFVAWLTDAMVLEHGQPLPQERMIHPRVEPEIVFFMAERLEGSNVACEQAMGAVEAVSAGAEIIDSRYSDFRFRPGDVVADNASSGAFTVGKARRAPAEIDIAAEPVTLLVDGEVVDHATGAAVLGHPGEALALAARELAGRGLAIEPGWIVLTGGMTDAVPAEQGSRIECRFGSLGSITIEA